MKAMLHRFVPRPIDLLIGAILFGSLALTLYVERGVGEVGKTLPVEVLNRQRELHAMLDQVFDLQRALALAVEAPTAERIDAIRRTVADIRGTLAADEQSGGGPGAPATAVRAATNQILSDLDTWLVHGLLGHPPTSKVVLEAMLSHTIDARRLLQTVLAEIRATASQVLEREAASLARFHRSLILAVALTAIIGLVLVMRMVHGQRARSASEAAEQRTRDAIESIPLGFALFDPRDRLVLHNGRYAEMYTGMPGGLAPGATFEDIIAAAVRSGAVAAAADDPTGWLAGRLRAFRSPSGPIEMVLQDRRVFVFEERRTSDGGTVAIAQDATEARWREAQLLSVGGELREKNFLLDTALDNMIVGLAMFDDQNRLIICNRRYLELYDLPPEHGRPGTPLRRIVETSAGLQGCAGREAEVLVEGRLAMAAMRNETRDREHLANGCVIQRVHRPMPDGGSIATYEDITERDKAERALHEAKEMAELASRSKSEFLANVSHELRTPLNAIIGFSEIIKAEMFGAIEPAQYRQYAGDIHDSGRHLLSLINDILDLSKIEAGKYEIQETDLDVAETVAACLRLIRERAGEAGIALREDLAPNLPALYADSRALKQILLNLLSNAVKFTETGGSVTVRARQLADGGLAIAVVDTGIGMTPDGIQLALEPFGQVASTLNRRHDGTGLGLPLSERLTKMHGGRLEVDSQVGVGTTVTVGFPAARVQHLAGMPRGRRAS